MYLKFEASFFFILGGIFLSGGIESLHQTLYLRTTLVSLWVVVKKVCKNFVNYENQTFLMIANISASVVSYVKDNVSAYESLIKII